MRNELAINGGPMAVTVNRPHYVWPCITEKTRESVVLQLDQSISIYNRSGIIERLEDRFAEYYGKRHALLTNAGTAAIYSMFVGASLKEGDEIICPVYTFYATVTPLFFTGATPVLADCGKDGNIDPEEIESKITGRTKGIVVTHMWGLPCDMDSIMKIAERCGIRVFEDGSHAHGATYKMKKVGTFGHASAFSLQAQKTVAAGEGGVLLTDDKEIFYRALLLGHYNKRCKEEIPQEHPLYKYAVTGMGLKLRIHPMAAAIAYEQFGNLESVLQGRRKMALKMLSSLGDLPGLQVPAISNDIGPSWYAFVMQYKSEDLGGLSIGRFYEAVRAEGCYELDRPGSTCPLNYHPLFQEPGILFPPYQGKIRCWPGDFPRAEAFHRNSLKLPVWHLSEDEEIVDLYIKAFKKVIANYRRLL